MHVSTTPPPLRCFTTRRKFYFITLNMAASYRAAIPSTVVNNHRKARGEDLATYILTSAEHADHVGYFFWATTGRVGETVQRRCGCACVSCERGDIQRCTEKANDTSKGRWWNRPLRLVTAATKETLGRSLAECKAYAKKLPMHQVNAPGSGFDTHPLHDCR